MITDINNYYKFNNINDITSDKFKVGIYVRLSREDDEKSYRDSESITNQKDSLARYVLEKKWQLVDIYADDGYSGTNFERPEFKRMILDIEAARINMVVTKDMSRLGRDYIGTGYYIERYFPLKNVRYIALNDGIDTFENSTNNDMGPFKTVMNDMYARDISKKIRFSMDGKKKAGKFIGAFAPYGYKKALDDKNKLIVDSEAAEVVERIFKLYLSGIGIVKIANVLNNEKIMPPSLYIRKNINTNYLNAREKSFLWSYETINKMLVNPTYAGNLTQNKFSSISYKIKKKITHSKENWIIVNGTHEPIISQEDFDEVQRLKKGNYFQYNNSAVTGGHLLAGIIYCGDCGQNMTFTKVKATNKFYIICSWYKRFQKCTRHSVEENVLNNYAINELKSMTEQVANISELEKIAQINKPKNNQESQIEVEYHKALRRIEDIVRLIKLMYEDKLKGHLSEPDFLKIMQEYIKERTNLEIKIKSLEQRRELMKEKLSKKSGTMDLINSIISFETMSKSTISKLIDKIIVHDKNNIEIHYKFKNPFL